MTRQRRLKRRIRARMAKTGESYATARREVLKRLGAVDRPAPSSPEAPGTGGRLRRHRTRIGAVGLVLAVAVAAVIVAATQRTEGPNDKGPSTASTVEVSRLADQCRRLHRLSDDVRRLNGGAAARRLVVECARLNRLLSLSAREREVVRSGRFPADELPPGLRELLMQRRLDLDRVRSVECGAGRRAPVDIRPSLKPSGTATCRIQLPGPADIIAFKSDFVFKDGDKWRIMRAVSAPRLRRWASVGFKDRSSKEIKRIEDDIKKLHPEFEGTAASLFRRASGAYGEVYSVIR